MIIIPNFKKRKSRDKEAILPKTLGLRGSIMMFQHLGILWRQLMAPETAVNHRANCLSLAWKKTLQLLVSCIFKSR